MLDCILGTNAKKCRERLEIKFVFSGHISVNVWFFGLGFAKLARKKIYVSVVVIRS
jgi:hypothetical protein